MEENGNFHCIGTLISLSQVLTVGSCVMNAFNGLQLIPINYLSSPNPYAVTRTVSKVISQKDKNKMEPMERLVVLEMKKSYSDENLKPVDIPEAGVLTDEATEYRVVTATFEESVNPHYDLLHLEEEYAHLKTSPDRQVTPAARSGIKTSAPDKSSLQKTIVIEDVHPLLKLLISSVLTQTSKECDDLVKNYFDSKENNHKIICSSYSAPPEVCKKDYGAPLVAGNTLVGIMSYSVLECKDPGIYQAVHRDNEFLRCARECQKKSCQNCKDVISVKDIPEMMYERVKERAAPIEMRSNDNGLQDCPEPTSTSTTASDRNQASNPQLLLVMMGCFMLYFLK